MCRDARAWSQQPRRRSLLGRAEGGRAAAAVDTMAMTEEEGADCADIGEKLRQAGQWRGQGEGDGQGRWEGRAIWVW